MASLTSTASDLSGASSVNCLFRRLGPRRAPTRPPAKLSETSMPPTASPRRRSRRHRRAAPSARSCPCRRRAAPGQTRHQLVPMHVALWAPVANLPVRFRLSAGPHKLGRQTFNGHHFYIVSLHPSGTSQKLMPDLAAPLGVNTAHWRHLYRILQTPPTSLVEVVESTSERGSIPNCASIQPPTPQQRARHER